MNVYRRSWWLPILACLLALAPLTAQDHQHPPMPAPPVPQAVTPVGPPVLENVSTLPHTVEVTITAAPTRVSLVPGVTTPVYAYNGRIPGPVLEAHEGDKVIVHFRNNLPEMTTIHWHGLHIPAVADGSPFNPVAPGRQYDYVFTIQPGSAGTYWYHPHPDQATGRQIALGLSGAFIVRPAHDPLPPMTEKLLVLSDNRFKPDGSIDWAEQTSPQGLIDEVNGREGNVLLVNGQVMPTISIRSGEVQRWRIVNASAARVYRLAIPGQTFLHVANDGGLFERPVEVKDIVLANSERVEILVRGTGAPGSRTVLQTLPYDRYVPQTRPKDWEVARDLLALQYSADPPVEMMALPERMRPVPTINVASATATRVIALSQGLINGKMMDMKRVDVNARVGATEIWQIENLVGMDHPFHLHGFQFQVLDRNGVPEPFRSWKDTVNVVKHEVVRFIVRYDDFPGKWMFHCHILDHEDHGMMGVLQLR
jgi:FtsP/CotA-like multicopper oxidase with cupredoxin domain